MQKGGAVYTRLTSIGGVVAEISDILIPRTDVLLLPAAEAQHSGVGTKMRLGGRMFMEPTLAIREGCNKSVVKNQLKMVKTF